MLNNPNAKPSFEEWLYWSQIVIDRLNDIMRVYSKPPFTDVFMPDMERQSKLADTVSVMKGLSALTDEADMPAPQRPEEDIAAHDEDVIADLIPLFSGVLSRMASWSMDMQKLLKSPWFDNCTGKQANDIFRGPNGQIAQGIGSGNPVHGRLPAILQDFLDREAMGENRPPRQEKPPIGTHRLQRQELARRWGRRNGAFLRSAGRVE